MMKGCLLIVALSMTLTGCAHAVYVTYHSDPEGASLYSRGALLGYTPVTVKYTALARIAMLRE